MKEEALDGDLGSAVSREALYELYCAGIVVFEDGYVGRIAMVSVLLIFHTNVDLLIFEGAISNFRSIQRSGGWCQHGKELHIKA